MRWFVALVSQLIVIPAIIIFWQVPLYKMGEINTMKQAPDGLESFETMTPEMYYMKQQQAKYGGGHQSNNDDDDDEDSDLSKRKKHRRKKNKQTDHRNQEEERSKKMVEVRTAEHGVTPFLHACYEVVAVCKEIQISPPSIVISFCASQFPSDFQVEAAVAASSVLTLQRHIERNFFPSMRYGLFQHYFLGSKHLQEEDHRRRYRGGQMPPKSGGILFDMEELAILANAANWIRLLPSMILGGPQMLAATLTLYITAYLGDAPVPLDDLGVGMHLLSAVAWLDYIGRHWQRVDAANEKEKKRKSTTRVSFWSPQFVMISLKELIMFLVVPVVLAVAIAFMMVSLAVFIESNELFR